MLSFYGAIINYTLLSDCWVLYLGMFVVGRQLSQRCYYCLLINNIQNKMNEEIKTVRWEKKVDQVFIYLFLRAGPMMNFILYLLLILNQFAASHEIGLWMVAPDSI